MTVVRDGIWRGFLRTCNNAAAHARGDYIVLLNNDTAVHEGWLDALLDVFAQDESTGMVGAKLLFEDGTLQEAGGIVWRNGDAWNYGRLDDPERSDYNYVREVDYVSAACLMIRRSLWVSSAASTNGMRRSITRTRISRSRYVIVAGR